MCKPVLSNCNMIVFERHKYDMSSDIPFCNGNLSSRGYSTIQREFKGLFIF